MSKSYRWNSRCPAIGLNRASHGPEKGLEEVGRMVWEVIRLLSSD
jgi:hypothetical protein